jgi:hypothetical protein
LKKKREALRRQMNRNLVRIEEGIETVRQHVKVDRAGRAFVDGFLDWADRVIARGNHLLSLKA